MSENARWCGVLRTFSAATVFEGHVCVCGPDVESERLPLKASRSGWRVERRSGELGCVSSGQMLVDTSAAALKHLLLIAAMLQR